MDGGCCAASEPMCVECRSLFQRICDLRPRLAGRLRSWGADYHTADELASESLLVAWRRLDQVPSGPGGAEAWVTAVARKLFANHRRVAGRRQRRSERYAAEVARIESHRLREARLDSSPLLSVLLAEAWVRLSAADREVLELVASADGVSLDTLGRALGCRPGAAATRLSRARARLRSYLTAQP